MLVPCGPLGSIPVPYVNGAVNGALAGIADRDSCSAHIAKWKSYFQISFEASGLRFALELRSCDLIDIRIRIWVLAFARIRALSGSKQGKKKQVLVAAIYLKDIVDWIRDVLTA